MVLITDGSTWAEEVVEVGSTVDGKTEVMLTDGQVIQVDSTLVTEIDEDMIEAFTRQLCTN